MTKHCCKEMADAVDFKCREHNDQYDCPDSLIVYSLKYKEYGLIIHDGGTSSRTISYCPFCGSQLKQSEGS